jgi:hypothetical protein
VLASFAAQTFTDFEVIVVDDGSSSANQAEYPRIWESLDERFILIDATPADRPGLGPAKARNVGARLAQGEFLGFCDDDDRVRLTDHLAVAIELMRATGADLYLCNMRGEVGDRVKIPDWFPNSPSLTAGRRIKESPAVYELALKDLLPVLHHHVPNPNCWLARRALFDATGGFWESVTFGEDLELFLQLADRADRMLYRPDTVIGFDCTPHDSVFIREMDKVLQGPPLLVAAMLRVAAGATRPGIRRCARAVSAWYLRTIAKKLMEEGHTRVAAGLNWQAVAIHPTMGGCAALLSSLARAIAEGLTPARRSGR